MNALLREVTSPARDQAISATISQHVSQGTPAQEAACLPTLRDESLAGNLSDLPAPPTLIHQQAVQPFTEARPTLHGVGAISDSALRGYQIQLMYLEQHKKLSLNMKRLEQDLDNEQSEGVNGQDTTLPIPEVGPTLPDNSSSGPQKRNYESVVASDRDPEGESTGSVAINPTNGLVTTKRLRQADPLVPTLPVAVANEHSTTVSHTPPSTRPTPGHRNSPPRSSPQYRILHKVICSGSYHSDKPSIFSCTPYAIGAHLDSAKSSAVQNILSFINIAGDISFLVLYYYRCSDSTNFDHIQRREDNLANDLWHEEAVVVVSRSLQAVINRISKCKSERAAYGPPNIQEPLRYGVENDEGRKDEYSMQFFYHHRNALQLSLLGDETAEPKVEISALLDYINLKQGKNFDEVDTLATEGLVQSRNIELLFCPNDIVITNKGGHLTACVLRAWPAGDSMISLDCWSWASDGNCFRRKPIILTINRPMADVVNIRDLEVFPVAFAKEEEMNYLLARGQKFWGLRYQSFVAYERWDFNADQYYSNGERWMVDYKTYHQIHPKAEPFVFQIKQKVPFDEWPLEIPHYAVPTSSQMLILPPQIHGFSFKDKKWSSLLVDNTLPVRWNKEAFGRLVLPSRIKDVVKSLVMVRASTQNPEQPRILAMRRDDIITGQGNGLIMLFHGGPGTGKTLTAESVAELAEMPLYTISCGEIGTKPEMAENCLEAVFMLGKTWNCVLLLDEADVFLEERSPADLKRNSLVSVFLRAIKNYDGILILTSNCVSTFDTALVSRIQVNLRYEILNLESRRRIWQNFFDTVQEDEEDADVNGLVSHIDYLATHEMNGHQIRNTFTTARQLALFKKETLSWDHMGQALNLGH